MQGRYKAVLVADDSHWLNLSAYIHLNPVRAGIVENPASYMWSSYRDYVRAKPQYKWLKTSPLLYHHGGSGPECRINYRKNILALVGKSPTFWDEIRDAIFYGTREQWDKLRENYPPDGDVKEVSDYFAAQRKYDFDEEVKRLAQAFKVSPEDIIGRKRTLARKAMFYHLVMNCGESVTHTAGLLEVTPSAVSKNIRNFREKMKKEKELSKITEELKYKVKI